MTCKRVVKAEYYDDNMSGSGICVTGGAGYIGSAVVRALGGTGLRSLLLLDSSEHGLFELRRTMKKEHPTANCEYVLGSVGDGGLLRDLFRHFRPRVVFHAAAFKHVGMLERNPFAAIENNALGTQVLVQAALECGVPQVVLVSTDKAVNPHSIMGVSKRIAELFTLTENGSACKTSAIRLGNVIGSTGSVVPIFLSQIAAGGPLLVTHPQASRYFLSREAAAAGILAAGKAACEGVVLIPELAEPLLVADLAASLARSHRPGAETTICFTGLGPGEKLVEELVGANETRIGMVDGPLTVVSTRRLSRMECDEAVARLSDCLRRRDLGSLLTTVRELVPEYVPSALMLESSKT